jgi:hypothetical protein
MVGHIKRAAIAAVAVLGLGAPVAAVALSAPASADTAACAESVTTHNGTTANWCASQEIPSLGLEVAVPNKGGVAYSRLTVKAAGENKQTDFQYFPPATPTAGNGKTWAYSPRGVNSGLCMDVSNSGTLPVLKQCVTNKVSQQWDAEQIGSGDTYEWVNEATGTALTLPAGGGQYTRLILSNPVGATGQGYAFTQ